MNMPNRWHIMRTAGSSGRRRPGALAPPETRPPARSAHRQVIELYQQAIHALGHMPEARATLLAEVEVRHGMRNAQLAAGDLDPIPVNMRRALVLADKLDDDRWRSQITIALAHYRWLTRDLSQVFQLVQRALNLAGRTVDPFCLGEVHWARGEYEAAVTLFRKNLEIAPSEVPRGTGEAPAPSSTGAG
jgi:hypothetical protein